MSRAKTAETLVKLAPPIRDCDYEKINSLFQAYLFIGKGNEVWATCCGTHKVIGDRAPAAEFLLTIQDHCPEPKFRWYKCANEYESSQRYKCPWCGAEAKVKRLQYCGKRKNLWGYQRAVVLRWWRGALWAVAYDCDKDYSQTDALTGRPILLPKVRTRDIGIYRFRPGKAECATRSWWYDSGYNYKTVQTAPGKSGSKNKMWYIHGAFGYQSDWGKRYCVINMDEIEKSPMRYCGIERRSHDTDTLIEELTACCFYPRQIEMLRKMGLGEIADDIVEYGVKNADIVNWDAERPADFIKGLTMQEIREAADTDRIYTLDTLKVYKRLKGTAAHSGIEACSAIAIHMTDKNRLKSLLSKMKRMEINADKLLRYCGKQGMHPHTGFFTTWLDYLEAAEKLGLDLSNPIIQMPGNLKEKHDQATQTAACLADKKKNEAFRKKRLPKLVQKYLWWNDEYLIRPAVSFEEIKREGETLKHCVGGYADRHLNGSTVILFLRRKDKPGKPLVTIEMDGDKVVQAHGYRNEWQTCKDNPKKIPPQDLYQEIFDEWKSWLKAGSKRTKSGEPRKKKVRKTA